MWFWLTVLLGLFAIVARRAYRFTNLALRVNRTPISVIRDLSYGFAVVEGKTVALESQLVSPITRQDCMA